MKLKTKFQDEDLKLGEVVDATIRLNEFLQLEVIVIKDGKKIIQIYDSLDKLKDDWEDAPEEIKKVWFIDADGELGSCTQECEYDECGLNAGGMKSIGNYFESEEEARKAAKKLKAWKRLKKDLTSLSWQPERDGEFSIWGSFNSAGDINADVILDNRRDVLDLLFGGEE